MFSYYIINFIALCDFKNLIITIVIIIILYYNETLDHNNTFQIGKLHCSV